jgi:CRP/FNR family transcriptional regulator, cyclic AMP receptor protein
MVSQLAGLAGSFLGDIDDSSRDDLLAHASLLEIDRGEPIYGALEGRRIGFLLEGIARAFITGPDGRQLTLRYARPRSLVTTATSGFANTSLPIGLHAVTPVTVVDFPFELITSLQRTDVTVVRALAAEATRRLAEVYRSFAATFFGTFRERLAAHLLDTAEQPAGQRNLIAPVTQQDLALALGTAREVVGRSLQQLQADGCVEIRRGGVVITDRRALIAIAGSWWVPSRVFAVDGAVSDTSFDASPQPVVGVDETGDVIYANAAVEATFGRPGRDMLGQQLSTLMPLPIAVPWAAMFSRFMDTVVPGPIGLGESYHGRRADGTEFPAEITILPMKRGDATIVFATVIDLTYRAALRERLKTATGPAGSIGDAPEPDPTRRPSASV